MKKNCISYLLCFFVLILFQNYLLAAEEGKEQPYVKIGKGDAKLGGYVQFRYENFKAPDAVDQFRNKTAVIGISGNVISYLSYKIEIDPVKSDKILNDAFFKCSRSQYAALTFGQFKVPFSEEYITSGAGIDTIERSIPVTNLSHERDRGIMIDANILNKKLYYGIGVFNGSGSNANDDNNRKDFSGRLIYTPFADQATSPLSGLSIGVNYMDGKQTVVKTTETLTADLVTGKVTKTLVVTGEDNNRDRLGGLIKYDYKGLKFQGEYINQKISYTDASATDITSYGWYAYCAYLVPVVDASSLQPIIKYEKYDPNTKTDKDIQSIATVGLNWIINESYKFMFNNRSKKDEAGKLKYDEFLVQAQVKF